MNVIIFGATGMVGQGVLRECLLDPDVQRILSIGRSATGRRHEKLRENSSTPICWIIPPLRTSCVATTRASFVWG